MKNRLKAIIHEMRFNVFTEDAMVDYLIEHDVVPVVRCGECKHRDYIKTLVDGTPLLYCPGRSVDNVINLVTENDFCNCGERETDD